MFQYESLLNAKLLLCQSTYKLDRYVGFFVYFYTLIFNAFWRMNALLNVFWCLSGLMRSGRKAGQTRIIRDAWRKWCQDFFHEIYTQKNNHQTNIIVICHMYKNSWFGIGIKFQKYLVYTKFAHVVLILLTTSFSFF